MKMGYRILILINLIGVLNSFSQIVYIPDTNFVKKLINNGVDKNGNYKIENNEAVLIDTLELNTSSITNLQGIEAFINLTYIDFSQNNVKTVDFSNNKKLKYLFCSHNDSLTNILIKNCIELQELHCFVTRLGNLDVSNFTNLQVLDCPLSRRTKIDVSKNASLKMLLSLYNNISEINLSNNPELTYLDTGWSKLISLDASKNPKLKYLDVSGNSALSSICVFDTTYAKSNPKFKKDPSQSWTQNCFPNGFEESIYTSSTIEIYPNPASENLTISGEVKEVKIYNANGTMALNGNSNILQISGLPKGIYQVHVVLNDGQSQLRKFVKE